MTTATNLPGLLAERVTTHGDKIVLRCEDETRTYAQLHDQAGRLAAGLAELGVGKGDAVALLLDTSCDHVALWLAINWLGAIEAPINTGFRGEALHHALRISGAKLLVADSHYRDLLPETPAIGLDDIATTGAIPPIASTAPSDTAQLLFTSGSTGPSKACRIPHGYVLGQPAIFCRALGITEADTLFAPFPLFHVDGAIFTVAAAIHAGATAAIAPRFSASRFWDQCRRHGATVIDYMGATLAILYRKPPSPADRDHRVRLAWGVPAPPFAEDFERRFGLELVEVYGLSDAGIVLANTPGELRRAGSCGKVIPPFDVRIHDENGNELADGETGEIVIKSPSANLITTGYEGDTAATEAAFRAGWFRTGDLARRDADGYFHFVGRLKDIIRRRGENISAFDLEQALLGHSDVAEAAAYGVPSDLTEEDVMIAIVPRVGASLDPATLRDWLGQRVVPHMVPRYVRIAASLPRTPTEKVAKHALAAAGITADTIDFEPRNAKASR